MKRLMFLADPSDIIEARQVLKVSEETDTVPEIELLVNDSPKDWYFFQSSGELINFYRGEYHNDSSQ